MKSPIELLIIITDPSEYEKAKEVLNSFEVDGQLIISGQGTAKTTIEELFGFSVLEKEIISTIVDSSISTKLMEKVFEEINRKTVNGIVFTVPISAISSDLFKMIKEDKND